MLPTLSSAVGKIGFCLGLNSVLPGIGLLLHEPSRIGGIRDINVVIVQHPVPKLLYPVQVSFTASIGPCFCTIRAILPTSDVRFQFISTYRLPIFKLFGKTLFKVVPALCCTGCGILGFRQPFIKLLEYWCCFSSSLFKDKQFVGTFRRVHRSKIYL